MTATEIAAWIAALSVPAGGVIAIVKYQLTRVDAKQAQERSDRDALRKEEQNRQDRLREELKNDLNAQIERMSKTIFVQGKLVNVLMEHIRLLEQKMARAGLEVPEFDVNEQIERLPYEAS